MITHSLHAWPRWRHRRVPWRLCDSHPVAHGLAFVMAACLARQPGDGRAGAARLPACLPPALACPRTRDPRGGSSCGPQLDGEPLLITHVHHTPACLPHRAPDVMTGWMEMIVRDAGGRAWQRSSLCPAILISGDDRYVEVRCARVMAGNRGADGVPRTASACTSTTGCAVQHGGPALRRNGTGALHHRHHHQQPACLPTCPQRQQPHPFTPPCPYRI